MPPKRTPNCSPPKTTTAKAASKKKPPPLPPPKPAKTRRAPSRSPSDPIPEWDKGISSLAARERKRFKLSRASLHEELDQDYIAKQAEKLMGESKNSWGVPEESPIKASRRPKQKSRVLKRGRNEEEDAYMAMFRSMIPQRREAIPNDLAKTPFLRVPLEVRESIYSHLLIYPSPIMVKSNWTAMERNVFVRHGHAIILVCKQLAFEASSFLFRNNTFQSLVREPHMNFPLRFEEPASLPTSFHSLFRNIIIDCSKPCWNLEWYEKATEGLATLTKASPTIDKLTLLVVPQRVGMSHTALGMEVSPVTFADFMWYPGAFMKAVRALAPKTFKIVVKKPGKKKLGIEIDLTYLRVGTVEDNQLANEETLRLREIRARAMNDELRTLKERFEEVFEDDDWAVREGKCMLISAGNGRRGQNDLQGLAGFGGSASGVSDTTARHTSRERSESEERWAY
ncbi:hypothetical protein ONS95_002301 [Cadophora gregata]|uniref:uncharacterized protein n=1 Tax=Cadophora gregata TaxID=51156 RepID=UPI0026DBBF5A|nr:uncharacterized protein ONS95_002301 [Cadophora gregata]KAK0109620.1 hypothetical protein ONS95_002301 [Cadophora gregata]KAK0110750.1 hypothetical protein ONS96_002349 [Cadophora gregata f. sp. sojae]